MKIHENETLINRNKMRIEELTIQMEGSQEIKEQWKEQNKIRQEIQQQNEMLKLENNKLQNHISNYAQSLKEKSKDWKQWNIYQRKTSIYINARLFYVTNSLIRQNYSIN
mgnify:CR=1 FL=1